MEERLLGTGADEDETEAVCKRERNLANLASLDAVTDVAAAFESVTLETMLLVFFCGSLAV